MNLTQNQKNQKQEELVLNPKQLEAVNSNEPNVLIIAPAGSGKTSTLIGAIQKYKAENPDKTVVAITFTNKATDELISRLGPLKKVYASTIHSWAYQQLDTLSQRVFKEFPTNAFKIKLLQDDKIKEILNDILKRKSFSYVKVDILFSFIMGNYNMDISDALRSIFVTVNKEYKEYKERYGLYDFTDLPEYLLDKLNDYDMDIEGIDALFVDEFQDVDDVQLELFERTKAEKKFFIGDPKQSIYIFRGATEDVMKKLKGFKLYNLDINYRSNQEIIDFASTYQQNAQIEPITFTGQLESYQSSILCERGRGGNVYVLARTGSAYKVNEFIKERGEKIVEHFLQLNPMILCRKNKEVKAIKELGWDRVQTIHQAKGLEYPAVIVTDFEIRGVEDINISYVAMTRAESHLLAANYGAFFKILTKLKEQGKLLSRTFLF